MQMSYVHAPLLDCSWLRYWMWHSLRKWARHSDTCQEKIRKVRAWEDSTLVIEYLISSVPTPWKIAWGEGLCHLQTSQIVFNLTPDKLLEWIPFPFFRRIWEVNSWGVLAYIMHVTYKNACLRPWAYSHLPTYFLGCKFHLNFVIPRSTELTHPFRLILIFTQRAAGCNDWYPCGTWDCTILNFSL